MKSAYFRGSLGFWGVLIFGKKLALIREVLMAYFRWAPTIGILRYLQYCLAAVVLLTISQFIKIKSGVMKWKQHYRKSCNQINLDFLVGVGAIYFFQKTCFPYHTSGAMKKSEHILMFVYILINLSFRLIFQHIKDFFCKNLQKVPK